MPSATEHRWSPSEWGTTAVNIESKNAPIDRTANLKTRFAPVGTMVDCSQIRNDGGGRPHPDRPTHEAPIRPQPHKEAGYRNPGTPSRD